MAHHGVARHHRWSILAKRRHHYSEEYNREHRRGQIHHGSSGPPASPDVKHNVFASGLEKRQGTEYNDLNHNSDILRRKEADGQQTGATRKPSKVARMVAGATDPSTLPTGNPTDPISSTALSHTTALITSSVSTDSSRLSQSTESPATSSVTHATQLTTDTSPPLTSDVSSTAQATPTAAQSAPIISHTVAGSAPASSNALASKLSTALTSTTNPGSTRTWSSTFSTDVSSTASSGDGSSYASAYLSTIASIDSPGGFGDSGGVGSPGGLGTTPTDSSTGSTATGSQPPQDSGLTPTENKIVGGVVGSVAGVTFLFLIALLYLRRRHASLRAARIGLPHGDVAGGATGEGSVAQSAERTSQRSSRDALFSALYSAPEFVRHWRKSNQTTNTDSTFASNSSERGFQKVSGRKIPSVLQSGGDGYGGDFGDDPPGTEMSMTFHPVSNVHLQTPTFQPPTAYPYGMPLDMSYTQESRGSDPRAAFRPSPARTPVASSTNIASIHTPTSPRSTPEPRNISSPTGLRGPDALGRSHPSFDGSRGSRFTEGL